MTRRYTIGQLAQSADAPTSTVRYYERRGLLPSDGRSPGNYRLYSEDSLDRLRFVRAAQAAGFTLSDIAALLRFRDGETAPCAQVRTLIDDRLEQVTEQIKHLKQVNRLLNRWRRVCCDAEKLGRCGVLEGLSKPCEKKSDQPPKPA